MPRAITPNKKDDHFGGELNDEKRRHIRKAIGHLLNDNRSDYEKGLKVVATPKTLLLYLKAESDIYDYLKKSDMDTNQPGFMKTMSNYINKVMKDKEMVSDLMEAHLDRKNIREISEDI